MTQRIRGPLGLIMLSGHGIHDTLRTMDLFLDTTRRRIDNRPQTTTQNTPVQHSRNRSRRIRFQSWRRIRNDFGRMMPVNCSVNKIACADQYQQKFIDRRRIAGIFWIIV